MRTWIDISDALLARARKVMAKERVTLDDDPRAAAFELRDARFHGPAGFAPGASEGDVSTAIRELNERASRP